MKKITFLLAITLASYAMAQTSENSDNTEIETIKKYEGDLLDLFKTSRKQQEFVCTTSDGVFAIGWNQALGNGNGIGDDYRFWGSGSWELGLEFSTRLVKSNDKARFNYGIAGRWQTLRINDNQSFQTFNNITTLQPLGIDTEKVKFNQFTLVAPLHLEIGAGKLQEYDNNIKRYNRDDTFVVGIGGYVGVNAGSSQRVKFEREGRDVSITTENDYEMETLVYGLSTYVGYGDIQLFATYGLNDIFKNSPVQQQFVSFGFRFR